MKWSFIMFKFVDVALIRLTDVEVYERSSIGSWMVVDRLKLNILI